MEARDYLLELLKHSRRPIFLTGKAGTGKTTLLKQITAETYKSCIVAAPTGIAALNAGGVTLHSLFQIPPATFVPQDGGLPASHSEAVLTPSSFWRQHKMSEPRRQLLRSLELLIIDEVSMLRADTLDLIDMVLRSVRRNPEPFGGVQVLFIGDLLQLPPVVRGREWELLGRYYSGIFFFHARALSQTPPIYIELDKVYRQADDSFVSLLNNLRQGSLSPADLVLLNRHVEPSFDSTEHDGYIMLSTHNDRVDHINRKAMDKLPSASVYYKAWVEGDFPEYLYPAEHTLELKLDARVMFLRNDTEHPRRYYNGKIGVVCDLSESHISVQLEGSDLVVEVERHEWANVRYTLDEDTQEPKAETIGSFKQYPLRAAWAITIHKSQGLTFERAAIDLERVFSSGQAYVALSRLTQLEGLVLLSPLSGRGIEAPRDVVSYGQGRLSPESLEVVLKHERHVYWMLESLEAMNWSTLIDEWRDHSFSYRAETGRSLKSNYGDWASETTAQVEELYRLALRFREQLRSLWASPQPDLEHIAQRVSLAADYFTPRLTDIACSTGVTRAQASRGRKVKEYLQELSSLQQGLTSTMQRLLRIRATLSALAHGGGWERDSLGVGAQLELWQDEVARLTSERLSLEGESDRDLGEDEGSATRATAPRKRQRKESRPEPEPKLPKEPKLRTHEITLELFRSGLSVEQMAQERSLTPSTIMTHLGHLIQEGRIALEEAIDPESIRLVESYLEEHPETEGLKALYEALEERIPYGALRLILTGLRPPSPTPEP